MVDGYLNFDTKINTSGFTNGVGKLEGKLDGLKSKLKSLAVTVGTVFGVKAIASFTKQMVESAASINAATSAMTQTFGTLEQAATDAMQRIADESGIVRTRLQGAGTQIFAFAKASGMDGASALGMMEDALRAAADSAAYYDRSLEETTETLKSFLKGNFANDAALGISCTETTRNAAANKMYAKSYRELSEAQKQLVLLQMVKDANRLSGAEGQAAREAEGWENVLGNLKETWKQLLAVIGQPALHLAISVVKMLTAALAELTAYAKTAVGALSDLFGWEDTETSAVTANIASSVSEQNDLTDATNDTVKAQKKLLSIDEMHTVGGDDTSGGTSGGAEAVAIAPTVDKKETEKTANKLTERLKKLLDPIRIAWELDSPALIAQAKQTAKQIKSIFKSVGSSLEAVWTNGTGLRTMRNLLHLATDFLGVIGDIAGAFQRAWDDGGRGTKYIQSITDRWNAFLELVHTVTQSFRDAWNNGNGESILGHVLEILTGINNITANLRKRFADAWEENGNGERIFDGILKTVDSVLTTFDGIVSDTAAWAETVDFAPLLSGLADLSQALAPLADTVGEGLRKFWNDVCLPMGQWFIEKGIPGAITLVQRGIEDLNTAIQALKPYLEWFVDELAKPVGNFLGDAFEVFTDKDFRPSEIFEGLGAEIADGTFWDTWAEGAKSMFSGTELTKNMEKFGEGVYDFFAGIGDAVSDFEHWFDSAFVSIDNFIIGIGQFFSDFEDELEGVGESVADTVHSIGEWFGGLWDGIKKTFSGIGKWFGDKFTAAKNAVTKAFSGIGNWFSARWTDIKNAFSAVGEWFSKTFRAAYDGICDAFSAIGDWFSDRWDDIKDAFAKAKEWFSEKFKAAYAAVTSVFKSIGSWFGDRWTDIKNVFAKVSTWFSDKFQQAYDAVTGIFKGIGSWFKARWDDITNAFSSIGTWFKTKFQSAYDTITGIFSGVGAFFDGIWDGIKTGVKSAVNFVIGGLNGMIEKVESGINFIVDGLNSLLSFSIPDWVPVVGGSEFSLGIPHADLPRIPYLAQGTVVPANYGNFLAVLGDNKREPEIVAPESTIRRAVAAELSALKTGGDITVKLVCDGRVLAQTVQRYDLKNRRATNGG